MTRILVVGLAGLLAGCVPAPAPSWLVQPADPQLGTRSPGYASVTSGVKRFGVVEPKDWRELNRAVGPQGGQNRGMNMPGMDMGTRRDTGGR